MLLGLQITQLSATTLPWVSYIKIMLQPPSSYMFKVNNKNTILNLFVVNDKITRMTSIIVVMVF